MNEQLQLAGEPWHQPRRLDQRTRRAGKQAVARAKARLAASQAPITIDLEAA